MNEYKVNLIYKNNILYNISEVESMLYGLSKETIPYYSFEVSNDKEKTGKFSNPIKSIININNKINVNYIIDNISTLDKIVKLFNLFFKPQLSIIKKLIIDFIYNYRVDYKVMVSDILKDDNIFDDFFNNHINNTINYNRLDNYDFFKLEINNFNEFINGLFFDDTDIYKELDYIKNLNALIMKEYLLTDLKDINKIHILENYLNEKYIKSNLLETDALTVKELIYDKGYIDNVFYEDNFLWESLDIKLMELFEIEHIEELLDNK